MHGLDFFTLNCVTIANMFLSSAAMFLVSRLNGQASRIRYCALAGFVISTGFGLAPVSAVIGGRWLNFISNVLTVWGACLLLRGIRGFRGLPLVRKMRFLRALALYAAVYAYFLFGYDSLRARSVLASAAVALLTGACAWAMGIGVSRSDRLAYWTSAGFYALNAVTAGARAVWFVKAAPHPSIFSPHAIDYLNVIAVNLAAMGGAFGLCLATNLRLIRETEVLALYDPLTMLPNRRMLEQCLLEAEARALASGAPLALIYCDLDDFKHVNDSLGHEAGDGVLMAVADRLRKLVSHATCLARVGGDEFIVLIEQAPARPELLHLMHRIETAVLEPIAIAGKRARPGISCGLAVFPDDVGSALDLVRLADAAMYAMKQHGRMGSLATD